MPSTDEYKFDAARNGPGGILHAVSTDHPSWLVRTAAKVDFALGLSDGNDTKARQKLAGGESIDDNFSLGTPAPLSLLMRAANKIDGMFRSGRAEAAKKDYLQGDVYHGDAAEDRGIKAYREAQPSFKVERLLDAATAPRAPGASAAALMAQVDVPYTPPRPNVRPIMEAAPAATTPAAPAYGSQRSDWAYAAVDARKGIASDDGADSVRVLRTMGSHDVNAMVRLRDQLNSGGVDAKVLTSTPKPGEEGRPPTYYVAVKAQNQAPETNDGTFATISRGLQGKPAAPVAKFGAVN